jgi:hypothetical protein
MTRNNAAALALLLVMALIVPLIPSDYMFDAILTPFLAVSLAALGLNLLAGYTGQVSLGSAAFMAVGAFSAYNFLIRLPGLPLLAAFLLAGVVAAVLGVVFGLPSLRLRGFYLAISTLAAQFFVQWALTTLDWFSDGDTSGVITTPPLNIAGLTIDSPVRRYLLSLAVVALLTLVAIRLVRSRAADSRRAGPADQIIRLRHQQFLHRDRRRVMGVLVSAHGGTRGFRPRPFVRNPVCHHHRRPRQHPRRVSGCRLYRCAAAAALARRGCDFWRDLR